MKLQKKRLLTESERVLWRGFAAGVAPLGGKPELADVPGGGVSNRDRPRLGAPVVASEKLAARSAQAHLPTAAMPERIRSPNPRWRASEPPMRCPDIMNRRLRRRLHRQQWPVERTLDLHGFSLDEAMRRAREFLQRSARAGCGVVVVITGKGRRAESGLYAGTLWREFPSWVSQAPLSGIVIQYGPAHPRHGGHGAWYVTLRRRQDRRRDSVGSVARAGSPDLARRATGWLALVLAVSIVLAPVVDVSAAQPVLSASERVLVGRAEKALNALREVRGRFRQTTDGGQEVDGRFFLSRPGRIRFQYDPPLQFSIRSDGSSVLIEDGRLGTQDLFPLIQTPLRFLVTESTNLLNDLDVRRVVTVPTAVNIVAIQSTGFGRSQLILQFGRSPFALRGWRVKDARGRLTTVVLYDLEHVESQDPALFRIQYDEVRGSQNR